MAAEQRKNGRFGLYLCNGNSRGLDPYTYYSLPQRCGILFPEFYGFDLWDFVTAPSDLNEYACDKLVFSPFYFDGERIYASKQVEAVYAGRQDYEYYLLLKKLMVHFRATVPETARRCEEQLKAIEAELMAEMKGPDMQYWDKPKIRETAERRRVEIWKLLESIAAKHPEMMERYK